MTCCPTPWWFPTGHEVYFIYGAFSMFLFDLITGISWLAAKRVLAREGSA